MVSGEYCRQGIETGAEVFGEHNRVDGSIDMEKENAVLNEQYRANGLVVVRGMFSPDLLQNVKAEVETSVDD